MIRLTLERKLQKVFPNCRLYKWDSGAFTTELQIPNGKMLYIFLRWKTIALMKHPGIWYTNSKDVANKLEPIVGDVYIS